MKNENKIAALPQREPVDPEVPAKPKRRTFTAAYKLRILRRSTPPSRARSGSSFGGRGCTARG